MAEYRSRKDFFDKNALDWQEPEEKEIEIIKNNIIPLLELKKGEKVLDACSGTGVLIPFLKDFEADITEYDFSDKMIEKAKSLYGDDISYIVGDIENMPFERTSFDKVICHNSFPHIQDKQKAFKEVSRVLKAGGIFLISHSGSKKEIDEHHKNCNEIVKNDIIPSNNEITIFAAMADFETVEICDEDKFFAVVCKK